MLVKKLARKMIYFLCSCFPPITKIQLKISENILCSEWGGMQRKAVMVDKKNLKAFWLIQKF